MQLKFRKMHGLGNDFMLLEWPAGRPPPDPAVVRTLGDRRRGVGFDSLLLIEAERHYRVFNADGGEAEQCGNGARCIAAYLADGRPQEMHLVSAAGPVEAKVAGGGIVSINLGEPRFSPASLPFNADAAVAVDVRANARADASASASASAGAGAGAVAGAGAGAVASADAETQGEADRYRLELASGPVEFGIVSMGNPHAVIAVDSVERAPVGIIGAELAAHPAFPDGVNVGFVEQVSSAQLKVRVYERGVGETPACGTGAAAAVATGRRRGVLDAQVAVELPGGRLDVDWAGRGSDLWQTGQTTTVFEGVIEI